MNKVIGVKFKDSGKIYYFDPLELEIEKGGNVIVETARGLVFGEVAEPPRIIAEESIVAPLKPVVRVATDEDRVRSSSPRASRAACLTRGPCPRPSSR